MIDNDLESMERIDGLKRNFVSLAKRLSKNIDDMEQFIMSCEYELNRASPS
jgi:hypothetical protein